MKWNKPGIIFLVGTLIYCAETTIHVVTLLELLQLSIFLDTAILADPQEDNPVYRALNREVQFTLRKSGVPGGDASGEILAPRLNLR